MDEQPAIEVALPAPPVTKPILKATFTTPPSPCAHGVPPTLFNACMRLCGSFYGGGEGGLGACRSRWWETWRYGLELKPVSSGNVSDVNIPDPPNPQPPTNPLSTATTPF